MLRSGMQETRQELIILHEISARALKTIIDFIYTGELRLSLDSIDDILRAISLLQVQLAPKLCEEYLIEETTLDNCIDIFNLADVFSLHAVKEAVNKFILRNFLKLTHADNLRKFSADQMSYFLQSNKLRIYPEINVFTTVCKWIAINEPERLPHAGRLMRHVRFHTMKPEEFIDQVAKTEFMKSDPACNAYLIEAYEYFALPNRQYSSASERSHIRNEACMVCVNESMYILNRREEIWQYLCHSNATCKTLSQKFVVVNNFLYACGGYSELNRETTSRCHRFDPRTGNWHSIACMNEKRQFFTLTSNSEFIVAVGGVYGDKGNFYATFPVLSPIEIYSIEKDAWKSVNCGPSVPILKWPGACVFKNNLLFIVGGKLTDGPTHNLSQDSYIVDLGSLAVTKCAAPITSRFNPSVFYISGDRILLFGGEDEKYRMAPCIEMYDLGTGQWSEVATIPVSLSYQCISSTCLTNNGTKVHYLLEEHGPSSESYILKSAYFDISSCRFEKSVQLPHPSTLASKWCNLVFPQEFLEKCQAALSSANSCVLRQSGAGGGVGRTAFRGQFARASRLLNAELGFSDAVGVGRETVSVSGAEQLVAQSQLTDLMAANAINEDDEDDEEDDDDDDDEDYDDGFSFDRRIAMGSSVGAPSASVLPNSAADQTSLSFRANNRTISVESSDSNASDEF